MDVHSPPSLSQADDRTIVGRAADGDVRAFEVLVRRYGPLMRAYATRVLGSNDETDDVVQESFITAWQQLSTLTDAGVVKSWLMRIVSRKSIDRIRARKQHVDIDDFEQEAPRAHGPERIAEAHSREAALSRALRAMPAQQRQCWVLKEIAEYSYDDIAAELDLPTSTVRGLLARARKNLMREMEEWR
ncbi:RNA polymerase sigma factor [Subtercola boreus]|uniref:RNA polymerase sigma factor n=1 Tax=Subtercola boreus TaxID=120213 RepID=A0A3E0WE96_9MICO|nr:sigma-70 family RNA polymerase sigma factor [Subtercola boreus]RFA23345.1 RNA polymerase subunit sigma-70 [Subtercola boreus]RFA23738.1 RNA polymerase subunit sigma-70 [Subtercola boreus]RFA29438.1 RNA polymerase subunit sigma-70 [Subtercola boreus]